MEIKSANHASQELPLYDPLPKQGNLIGAALGARGFSCAVSGFESSLLASQQETKLTLVVFHCSCLAEQHEKNLWYPGYFGASLNMDTDRKKTCKNLYCMSSSLQFKQCF